VLSGTTCRNLQGVALRLSFARGDRATQGHGHLPLMPLDLGCVVAWGQKRSQVHCRIGLIILRHGAADVGELGWAPHPAEVHEGIVGLPALRKPAVPIVAPPAARLQLCGEPVTSGRAVTPAVIVVAIEVAAGIARKLRRATAGEDALPSPGNLDVEAVFTGNIVADVTDLDDHALSRQVRVRPAPIPVAVDLVNEAQLEALAAILISRETVAAAHSCSCEAHAQATRDHERLIVGTRSCSAPVANRRHIRIEERFSCVGIASKHGLCGLALARPRAARLAAIPIPSGVGAGEPSGVCRHWC